MEYLDFDLHVGLKQAGRYPVTVHSPAGEANDSFVFPYSEGELRDKLKDLKIALFSSMGLRRVMSPEIQVVQDFGQILFNTLFTGEVRTRYDVSCRMAVEQGKGLRIRLRILAPELGSLPWEYLYDPRKVDYICLSTNTPLTRYLELPQPVVPLEITLPLRVLGVVCSPTNLAELDVDQEKRRIEEALQPLRKQGLVTLSWLEGSTWRDLQRALSSAESSETGWHVFHFIGHGYFDDRSDEGKVALVGENGRADFLSAIALARLLADQHSLRLVVLNVCEGAQGSQQDIFSSTAATLVQHGIATVLAMQQNVSDPAAIELARTFYENLAKGVPVDAALGEARKAISMAIPNTLEWGTPVLFMRAPDGVLFRMRAAAAGADKPAREIDKITKPGAIKEEIRPQARLRKWLPWLVGLAVLLVLWMGTQGIGLFGGLAKTPTPTAGVAAVVPTYPVAPIQPYEVPKNPANPSSILPSSNVYSWSSIIAAQNIGLAEAETTMQFLSNGQMTNIQRPGISPGNSQLIDVSKETNMPQGFAGGVVMSSTEPLLVTVFMQGTKTQEQKPSMRFSYMAAVYTGKTLYYPVVKGNYYGITTKIYVQNSSAIDSKFQAKLKLKDGSNYDYVSPKFSPGESIQFSLNDFHIKESASQIGVIGSLFVSSDETIASTAYEYKNDDQYAIVNYIPALSIDDATDRSFVAERSSGQIVSIHIINVDTKPGEFEVIYGRVGDSEVCTNRTYSAKYSDVKPDDVISITQQNINPFINNCWLYATISGTSKYVAGVSEADTGNQPFNNAYYKVWSREKISNNLAFPFFADNYNKLVSLIQIQNASQDKTATIVAEFNCEAENNIHYQAITKPVQLKPYFAFQIKEPSSNLDLFDPAHLMYPNSWCSVIVRSDQPIVAFNKEISRDPSLVTRVDYDAGPLPDTQQSTAKPSPIPVMPVTSTP